MRHQLIKPGMTVRLTPSAKVRYGLDSEYEVSSVQPRDGYTVPWIYVKSHRPEGGILAFKPSDLRI